MPEWAPEKVALHAKYLGIHSGPRSVNLVLTLALHKYIARIKAVRTTGAGLLTSIIEHSTMCIPTLNYIGQFGTPDASVLAADAIMLQILMACPVYIFTKEALWSLDAFGMGRNSKSIKLYNMFTRNRSNCTIFAQ